MADDAPEVLKLTGLGLTLDESPVDKLFTSDDSACPITFSVVQDSDDKTNLSEENQKLISIADNKITLNQSIFNGGDNLVFQLKAVTPFDKPQYIKIEVTG